ncbi:prolyl oligopeptidase family protein [Marinilabilia salmonicolor]|jgi:prolyl oligopeptidase|uniref:prolyl oligopeptidase n=1 Tax=Marinilabilia salmonicolor TaxID=989 RepID=A0A2T0XA21_9BACT|nr:prolyl oligopeptidase family serine peptidase [Marinilabilia salmonicolor]PRY95796.1 prolyl oligopeptidase [Marinilabilia salmonicolor]RCW36572.1 prolyl oligopeptidase [Marinilabilia salmonicolor]
MNYRILIVSLLAMATLFSCKDKGPDTPEYPETKKVDTVDVYYGTEVPDPYRWLEDDQSEETKDWVQRQVKVTNKYLSEIPFRDRLKERLTEVWNYEKQGTPVRKGKYWFFMRNNGLQNQYVVYVKEGEDGEERVLLDPNKLSDDGTVALSDYAVSEDGTYMAYSISRGGSDWREIYVLDVATGEQLDDHLEWVKFSGISWMGEKGFVYSRYDAPAQGEELTNVNEFQQVYYHQIGDEQSQDELIYKDPVNALRNFTAEVDDDNKNIVLSGSESTSNNSFLIREWNSEEWAVADTSFENNTVYLGTVNGKYWVLTDFDAPRYRVMAINPENPAIDLWEEVVAEKGDVLNGVALSENYAVAHYMVDAESKLLVFDFFGKELYEIELPGRGSVGALRTTREDDELFYSFDSYNVPGQVIDFNLETRESDIIFEPEVDFDGDNYETRLVFIEAEDGAQVPLHIVHKKGIELDGNNPLMLYGYGGFNVVYSPGFDVRLIPWLENGGVYVNAHIRGGGEYGEDWHQGGTKLNKQRVFDDFILAAEKVIEMGYTNADKIAIRGGSNGGLLLGAVVNQRPELFQVSLPAVGVMDMLRYHKFTIGWAWAGDYGRSDESEEMFRYLYGYSPVHNIKSGVDYPATLVFTADHDDRVVPAHSFKYIATLQEKYKGENPVLIRIETKAGHGAGKPVSKQIEEVADMYAFTFYNMGLEPYNW